jgi:hypothetical protein
MNRAISLADFGSSAASASPGGTAGSQLHRTWEAAGGRGGDAPRANARRAARREYRLVWGIAFLIFLAVALAARILPPARRVAAFGARRSVLGDARALTNSTIPIAFGA